jgi:uncharacterized protein YbjT (DUF2867 family)
MIFVTGATGNVGREVVRLLSAGNVDFRVGVRSGVLASTDRRSVVFDFLDPATFPDAVAGAKALFLLRPPAISNTKATLNVLVDVARAAGVQHVLFVSVAGAGKYPFVPHYAVERHLKSGPPGWTILRPGFFAQNLGGPYRLSTAAENCAR